MLTKNTRRLGARCVASHRRGVLSGLRSLVVRDLVAFAVTLVRATRRRDISAREAVTYGFDAADEFLDRSDGHWARTARESRNAFEKTRAFEQARNPITPKSSTPQDTHQ